MDSVAAAIAGWMECGAGSDLGSLQTTSSISAATCPQARMTRACQIDLAASGGKKGQSNHPQLTPERSRLLTTAYFAPESS
jgi:hypothetical protein